MATYLPTSGALAMSCINSVFGGRGNNLNSYRGTTYYKSTGGAQTFSSGAISFSCFYGTGPSANAYTYTVASNQTNFCMRAGAVSAGWCQSVQLIVNINSGVIISSNGTGTPAMTIQGSFPGGVRINNSGVIVGKGGNGGNGGNVGGAGPTSGAAGGTALKISSSVTFCNASGVIAGGGGGGNGGAAAAFNPCCIVGSGGGGGGGRSSNFNSSGGSGGSGGAPGSPGGAGTYSSAGAGGAGGSAYSSGSPGGSGGNWGTASGGAGGKATCGASLVTWTATGTRYGSVS